MEGIKKGGWSIFSGRLFPLCAGAHRRMFPVFVHKRSVPGPNRLTIHQLSDKN
jgi:hypothetical protein